MLSMNREESLLSGWVVIQMPMLQLSVNIGTGMSAQTVHAQSRLL